MSRWCKNPIPPSFTKTNSVEVILRLKSMPFPLIPAGMRCGDGCYLGDNSSDGLFETLKSSLPGRQGQYSCAMSKSPLKVLSDNCVGILENTGKVSQFRGFTQVLWFFVRYVFLCYERCLTDSKQSWANKHLQLVEKRFVIEDDGMLQQMMLCPTKAVKLKKICFLLFSVYS